MKTTVEITDSLLEETRKLAAREGVTVRALIEQRLRRLIAERERDRAFESIVELAEGRAPWAIP